MKKKGIAILILIGIVLLAACSSLNLPGSSSGTATESQQNDPVAAVANAGQPVEMRLALGTLALEDTELAVTAEQAKELLPLWKAVKSLSSSETASQEEISAVYTQIKETMTAEQVQKIETMELTSEQTSAIMEKYGIEMPQNPMADLSEDERATRVAQFQAQREQSGQAGQGMPAGGPGEGGFAGGPPPDGGGFPGAGGGPAMQGGPQNAQGTPQPGGARRGMRGGMNQLFLDPLIELLQERAGA